MKLKSLKGTREYLPKEQIIREAIIEVLKNNFKRYGYAPIETSILEFYDIASSKYAGGSEIVKEIYKLKDRAGRSLCLRYELTFKLAKLIGLNPQLGMPLKRYEIGKIFRDGPIKTARLREFTQCDVDCVGSLSFVDAEFMALTFDIFSELGLDIIIQINNRKLLFGLLEECGVDKKKIDSAVLIIDKLEKYGKQQVIKELKAKEISELAIKKIFSFFDKTRGMESMDNEEKINFFRKNLNNEQAIQGLQELDEFFSFCKALELKENLKNIIFTPSLARGLAYYTGMMWEVYLKNSEIKSSVAAGGRWDNMIQKFLESKQAYPASGMTFGLDVIYEALKEKSEKKEELSNLNIERIPNVLIIPIGTLNECLGIAQLLRKRGISVNISEKGLSKALDYANKQEIKYCIIIGSREISEKRLRLKNMESGKEELLTKEDLIKRLSKAF